METVTVIGVFIIVVTTVVNLYLIFSRSHRIAGQRQKIIAVANALLDQISYEVRTHELAYWGVFDYNSSLAGNQPAAVYTVDKVSAEGLNPNTNIFRDENELVLYDNGGDESVLTNDTIISYVFVPDTYGGDLCADDTGTIGGFFRFIKSGTGTVTCQRLFDIPGLKVLEAGFFYTQTINPYPDAVDAPTFVQAWDSDCGPVGGTFNGAFCTCTSANQANNCYSRSCDTTTSADSNFGHCRFGDNRHPAVTIYFKVQDSNNPGTTLTFQTTASQRLYKR